MPFLRVWYPCVLLPMILFLTTHQRILLFAWARNVFLLAQYWLVTDTDLMFFLFYVFFFRFKQKVRSLTNWWNYTALNNRLKQFDKNIKTIKLFFHNLLFFRKYATHNDVAIQTVNISIFIPFLNFFKPLKVFFFIRHRNTFYSIFNMSSCRKPEIHNDFP